MSYSDLDAPSSSSLFSGSGGPDLGGGSGGGLGSFGQPSGDINSQDSAELQQFLAIEQEKARMRAQIQLMTDLCWDKCVSSPTSKLESKTETCLDNCAQRFVDVSLLITQRFATMLQKQAGHM